MTREARWILRYLSPLYLRLGEGISTLEIRGMDRYLSSLAAFKRKETGLVIAFRHIAKADAPILSTIFGRELPRHLHERQQDYYWVRFLFGSMVLDWAGPAARWLFPRIGSLPVDKQRLVRSQIDAIRQIIDQERHPLCLAPEGQVNYYNYRSGEVTRGLTHFIRWNQRRYPSARVQPIRILYYYSGAARLTKKALRRVFQFASGIPGTSGDSAAALTEASRQLISWLYSYLMEQGPLNGYLQSDAGFNPESVSTKELVEVICRTIIHRAADHFTIPDAASPLEQLFHFRNRVFDQVRESGYGVASISREIRRQWRKPSMMSDLLTSYQHQQILDVLINFQPRYHLQRSRKPNEGLDEAQESLNRRAEQALCLLDIINRVRGGDVNSRFMPRGTKAIAEFMSPMDFPQNSEAEGWVKEWKGRFQDNEGS
ncbi:hypothetical protein [Salinispira pacifica]|uniref:Phospholipid/glycerol acyltransferase domain-containing protein n=1 Tax=Salinispira pacifica TaxID=1307761 RepID=V5WH27_9SPIO|nr:hypothetical protein [Salinispira pacifica]AHC14864.1 hypothetical protein L21SP2_1467 [Salinispira pacifica]